MKIPKTINNIRRSLSMERLVADQISEGVVTAENWGASISTHLASSLENLDYVDDNVAEFSRLTHRMLELYSQKNRDYGESFNKSLDEDGLLVVKIRLGDKLRRFNQLIKSGESLVEDESLIDTLMDLANYSAMAIMWIEKEANKKDGDKTEFFADGDKQDI